MPTTAPPDTRAMPAARPPGKPRRRRRWSRSWWPAVAAVVVMVAALLLYLGQQSAEDERDTANVQLGATADRGVAVAAPVLDFCDEATPVGEALRADPRNPCGLAQQVLAEPIVPAPIEGPRGETGETGDMGPAGRGITNTDVNAAGDLVVFYSDGTSENVGHVVGRDGGMGPAGRGVAGSDIVDGRLVISYTDGQVVDLGPVVGRDGSDGADGIDGERGEKGERGRGVADVDQVEGRLIVTYDDGSTDDAGPLPVAEPPAPPEQTAMWCPPGESPQTVTYGIGGQTGTACVAS